MRFLTSILFLIATSAYADSWTPNPKFSIDGSNHTETLIFISGLSYGILYSAARLAAERKANFHCLPKDQIADSKLLIDLLNRSLTGNQSAEVVTSTALAKLAEAYPCR